MEKQENYFILLGISFDPIENDEEVIKEIIKSKQQEWSKLQNHPYERNQALENLKLIPDIERIMLNSTEREKLVPQAKQIRKYKLKELEKDIMKKEAKGFLKPKEFESLVNKYKNFGISHIEIKNKIKKPISESKPVETESEEKFEIIDPIISKGIENNFKQLKLKDYTLYKFLGVSENTSIQKLLEAAEIKRRRLGSDANKTGYLNIELDLCGKCLTIFKDKISKQKYDNYISISKYGDINEEIKKIGASNKKELTPEMIERIIEIGVESYNISVTEAASYIRKYCKANDYIILGVEKIVCGYCKTENKGSIQTCSTCGKPLIIECPKCQTKNGNIATSCVKCRFNISKMNDAIQYIIKANKSLQEKNISEAIKNIEESKVYWPNHPDIQNIENQIANLKKKYEQLLKEITDDIKQKKYYSAKFKINQMKNDGFNIDNSIQENVNQVINDAEIKLKQVKLSNGEQAFLLINDIMKEISDCTEANKLVKLFPPEDVTNITYEINANDIMLSWDNSKSLGDKEYIVVRKINSYPNNEKDGDVLYIGDSNTYCDGSAETEKEYFYAIFTKRANIISKGCNIENPIVLLNGIESLKVICGDGIATLSWKVSNTITDIKVWMIASDNRPNSVEECERVICNRLDGLNITNLQNGIRYWFYVSSCHTINGNIYESKTKLVSIVPQKPAQPLQGFKVKKDGELYIANWEQSEWDIILFRSMKKPNYSNGTIYNISELSNEYEKIDIKLNSTTEAEFYMDFIGGCYIIPGVINSTSVILNSPIFLSNVPLVKNIGYDTNSSGSELYVNFDWPKKINKILMVYRMDDYPEDYNDPLAKCIECTKKQYDYDAALLINNPLNGTYYTKIYSIVSESETNIYSKDVKFIINNESQKGINYRFKYKKGFLSKKRTLELTVKSNGKFILPEFIIESKYKSVPLTKGDGVLICSVMEETAIKDTYTFTFEIGEIRKGTYLKMFLVNDKNYKRYRLINEGKSEI